MMTATEITLKSPSIPLFQRRNFLHRTLTPLWKKEKRRFLGGVRRELFGQLFKNRHLQAAQKGFQRRGARKIDERRRTQSVRWSEAIERNEAYESFSAACLGVMKA